MGILVDSKSSVEGGAIGGEACRMEILWEVELAGVASGDRHEMKLGRIRAFGGAESDGIEDGLAVGRNGDGGGTVQGGGVAEGEWMALLSCTCGSVTGTSGCGVKTAKLSAERWVIRRGIGLFGLLLRQGFPQERLK